MIPYKSTGWVALESQEILMLEQEEGLELGEMENVKS